MGLKLITHLESWLPSAYSLRTIKLGWQLKAIYTKLHEIIKYFFAVKKFKMVVVQNWPSITTPDFASDFADFVKAIFEQKFLSPGKIRSSNRRPVLDHDHLEFFDRKK